MTSEPNLNRPIQYQIGSVPILVKKNIKSEQKLKNWVILIDSDNRFRQIRSKRIY